MLLLNLKCWNSSFRRFRRPTRRRSNSSGPETVQRWSLPVLDFDPETRTRCRRPETEKTEDNFRKFLTQTAKRTTRIKLFTFEDNLFIVHWRNSLKKYRYIKHIIGSSRYLKRFLSIMTWRFTWPFKCRFAFTEYLTILFHFSRKKCNCFFNQLCSAIFHYPIPDQ